MLSFICEPCRDVADGKVIPEVYKIGTVTVTKGGHRNCKGGTWCDCQHRVKKA